MRNSFIKKNANNKIIVSLLSIGLLVLVIGFSYAFFIYNKTGLYTYTITGGKMRVIYDEEAGNNILIENAYPLTNEEALTKALEFEFTITGYNESDKNVYYAIEMDHGSDITGKNRFLDSDMKLSLYENDEVVFENEIFENLDNQDIHYGHFNYGTSSLTPVVNNYKMRFWINDNVIISDTLSNNLDDWNDNDWDWLYESHRDKYYEIDEGDSSYLDDYGISVYTSDEFANNYANFKVNVRADLTYDDIEYLTYDANGGDFTPKKTSLVTGRITTQKPVMTGKGFLGWSRNRDATEPEYTSGDTYIENEQVLYAVYSDTINVMSSFPSEITSINSQIDYIKFINIPVSRMEEEIVEANIVVDLTYEDIGMVTGYVIEDTLYIASEGTTYLSDGYELFKGFSNLNNIDFSNGDSYYVEDMESMFSFGTGGGVYVDNEDEDYKVMQLSENYYQEPVFSNFEGFRTDNAKTMKKMFYKVESIDGLSFENFNTSNVEDMSYMFSTTYIREIDVSSFDTSNVTNMSYMFSDNMFLESINVNKFNTSKVINMSRMFGGNVGHLNIDVSSFDTKNVTNMEEMFAGSNAYAGNIRYLDLRNFNTSNVTNMRSMFSDQNIIIELDLSSFNTSNVVDMSSMFADCSSMNNLVINSFDVKKVMNMSGMFYGCENLLSLDLSHFDTSNVENFSEMFSNCRNLEYLEISKFDGSCATNISYMFRMCYSLLRIDMSSFVIDFEIVSHYGFLNEINTATKVYVANYEMKDFITNRFSQGPGGDKPYGFSSNNIIVKES